MKVPELKTIEGKVFYILQSNKETRDSDKLLFIEYLRLFADEFIGQPIENAFLRSDIPSYEGITRARRKIQNNWDELRGTNYITEARANNEQEYREYAIN